MGDTFTKDGAVGLVPPCLDCGRGGPGVVPTGPVECVWGLGTAGMCGGSSRSRGSPSRIETHGEVPRIKAIFDDSGSSIILSRMGFQIRCHDSFHLLSPNPLITILVTSDVTSPTPLGLTDPIGCCHDRSDP